MDWNDLSSESGEINDWIHDDKVVSNENARNDPGKVSLGTTNSIMDQEGNTGDTETLPKKYEKRHAQDSSSESDESNDEDKAWQRKKVEKVFKKHKGDWEFSSSVADVTKSTECATHRSKVLPIDWLQSEKFKLGEISNDRIAKSIAYHLLEPKVQLIQDVVNMIGVEKSLLLTRFTLSIENGGGMLTKNGRRKRYPGGVFLYLLGSTGIVQDEIYKEIIKRDRQRQKIARTLAQGRT